MKIHLITFGDDNYKNQKEFFKQTALNSTFFDEINVFSGEDIDNDFYKQVYRPIKFERGGGYWTWKPYFIKKVLDNIQADDVLVYCDAGCVINSKGRKRFEDYLDMIFSSRLGHIGFSLVEKEYQFTKREVFDHFNASEEVMLSNQLVGGIQVMRKCSHTTMIVNEWYRAAIDHIFLFTDEQKVIQHPDFIDHRHDQSVFSVIRKTYGTQIIPDETYFSDFIKEGKDFPFWAIRLKG